MPGGVVLRTSDNTVIRGSAYQERRVATKTRRVQLTLP
jgi:hypothetical protein